MIHKIIFVLSLIAIFICEFCGIKFYLQKIHKGRLIDSIIAILLIVFSIAIITLFTHAYNKFFALF